MDFFWISTALNLSSLLFIFFFFNDTATTEIYTLSLHDALPIFPSLARGDPPLPRCSPATRRRSEEHTSELQSHVNLVCRLLLEKKKKIYSKYCITKKQIKETTITKITGNT